VEKFIYSLDVSNNYKNKLFEAYQYYANANTIAYKKPKKLRVNQFIIHVPTEQRIDKIIACCGRIYVLVFSLSKYGIRPDELSKLTLRNLDLENNKLTIPTSKLGNQRTLILKPQIVDMLKDYIGRKRFFNPNSRLFASARKIKFTWVQYRKRAYEKFKDSELLKIRLYDLRHWFGTMKYLETHDIFYVQYLLGHKRINNTLVYIHLSRAFENYDSNYSCKVAKTVDEASKLIESGFEYVTDIDAVKLFRKRK
jgi:integrase